MALTAKLQNLLKEREQSDDFYQFTDSEGNELEPEDILFVNPVKKGKQRVEMWDSDEEEIEGYSIKSAGVHKCYSRNGVYPIALRMADNTFLTQKVSKFTGEDLPSHAGCAKQIDIVMYGASNTGKTTYKMQLIDPEFQNMTASKKKFCMMNDTPENTHCRKTYEKYLKAFKKEKKLPDPTLFSDNLNSSFFYVKGEDQDAVLVLRDASGEECIRMNWDSKILNNRYFIYMIGADDLLSAEGQYEKVLEQLISKLNVIKGEMDYEILVTITKCDLLDKNNPHLKGAFKNSLEFKDGKLVQRAHAQGFDYKIFNQRSEAVQNYLKDTCPNFYNKLTTMIPEENITFAMMANIGEECHNNTFTNYRPFCIDEPILSILTKAGLYPVAVEDDEQEMEDIPSILSGNWISKMLDMMNLEEDDE